MENIRKSNYELLKILAILMIIICHSIQTVKGIGYNLYNLNYASNNLDIIITCILANLGEIGNNLFFICSVWFLSDSFKLKKNKLFLLIQENHLVSVIYLIIFLLFGIFVSKKYILFSLFPTIFGNNWYITCYLIIYILHPFLNKGLGTLNKNYLKILAIMAFVIYYCICFFSNALFFNNPFVTFLALYIIIYYLKKYEMKKMTNLKLNVIIFGVSLLSIVFMHFILNYLSLIFPKFDGHMYYFINNNNILALLLSISLFNIFGKINLKSRIINYISSSALLIYITHENILFRTFLRRNLLFRFKSLCSLNNLCFTILLFSIIIFAVSLLISILFKNTLEKILIIINKKIIKENDNIV